MRIFVTGGSGFIGGHVIERLATEHTVFAMARSPESAKRVERYGAKAVRTDLSTIDAKSLEGIDVVVHSAAFVEEWGTRAQFVEGNVEGTRRMLEAAQAASVRRFIHIGTEAALFDGHDLVDVDETFPYPAKQRFLYSETKAEAERLVLAANRKGFEALSLRPRLVWGPRDTSVLPAVMHMANTGAWAWLDGGNQLTSTTHVDNLVHAVELALTRGKGGEAYFVADAGTRTIRSFLSALARTQGVVLPPKNVKSSFALPLARIVEGIWRMFGIRKTPPMTEFAIAMMSSTVTVSTAKASRDLGYEPEIEVEIGLRRLSESVSLIIPV